MYVTASVNGQRTRMRLAMVEASVKVPSTSADVPTLDSIGPDITPSGFVPETEWTPYTEAEIECIAYISRWLGAEMVNQLPHDTLAAFVRGHAYRSNWHAVSFVHLELALQWRRNEGVDRVLAADGVSGYDDFVGGACRREFDALLPAGVIGRDTQGHLVVLDRPFAAPCHQLMSLVSDAEFTRHMVARREVARAALAAESARLGKRVYKVIGVIDMGGLGLAHLTDARFHARMRAFFEHFSYFYPETQTCMVVINAPRIFSAFWAIARRFLHPLTASKIHVAGASSVKATFDELGITLDEGVLEPNGRSQRLRNPPTWIDTLARLKDERPVALLTQNYLPDADAEVLERAGVRPRSEAPQ